MNDDLAVRPHALWARAIVEAESDDASRSVWLAVQAFVSPHGEGTLVGHRPYWKMPGTFELLVSIAPLGERTEAFETLRDAIGPATSSLEDGCVILARDQAGRVMDPRVVWLSIEPVDEPRPRASE